MWSSYRLDEVARIVAGGKSGLSGKHFVEEGFPAYGAGGLNGMLATWEYENDAVVLSSIGARCGKCFLPAGKWTSLANTQLIFPDPEIVDRRFLWHLLNDEARWHRSGSAQPYIRPSDVKSHRVALPPLPEQRRIASILDKAENRAATVRTAQSQLADLELAVYESFAEAAAESVRLADVAIFVRGVTFKPESVIDPLEEGALRFMRTTNVKDQLDTTDVKAISSATKVRDDQILRDGDILVSTANSWNLVGRASYISGLPWPSTFGGFVSVLRINDAQLAPRFVHSWFTSPRVQSTLRSFGQQTTNISNLNIARALELRVPVLKADDRERFESATAAIDSLRVTLRQQSSLTDELISTLRTRAFKGEL